jgi:hypothetical protein
MGNSYLSVVILSLLALKPQRKNDARDFHQT